MYVALLVAVGLLRRLAGRDLRSGPQLVREFRTSFYRKLSLAFIAAAVIPVLILALGIRNYVAGRMRADVEAEAARTAAVAQRVLEEALAAQQGGDWQTAITDDDGLIWVSRVLGQDVNLFEGPQLVATSERDLFASGLLPTRVPASVYRAIVLQRQPSFVGEDEIGGLRYLMAAAPVRAAGDDTIVTVPLASRQREIEREIDELDRGVQLGALLFIVFGAGLGFWMAERIADPVQRLTRASRRIAAGDLDARVFVRSADELQRLVEAFNGMAVELQRQRSQLERTNRLEAWAEMARQVAHDIKNPLTPIQLSAEHLRRVHRDRGEPLSPVLEACVDTILSQVRLLRQISSEFSSFASSPTPKPVKTSVEALLREVVQAYEPGLAGRVAIGLDVAPGLPDIQLDRALMGRALANVMENALHALPGGGEVRLRAFPDDGGVAIVVEDTGVGMDEEALARIFEPYFSTKATGTGLGLTIAKRNVELHGGAIAVESRRHAGTRVTMWLPGGRVTVGAAPSEGGQPVDAAG
jgi:two-component system, NtrC family, nitrogen regulation sensor histidine kinase NtrY